jgi:hypothetical protein
MKGLARAVLGGCSMLLLLARPAFAADSPKAPPPTELVPKVRPTTTSFYGWEILATGTVGGVLAAAGTLLPDKPLGSAPATAAFVTGMPLFVLGGPSVHWSHGDFSKGLVSFGGNVALPLIGGLVGHSLRCKGDNAPDSCGVDGFLTGMAVTSVFVSILDALVLGWEHIPVDDSVSRGPIRSYRFSEVSIVPRLIMADHGLVQLGLAGRF